MSIQGISRQILNIAVIGSIIGLVALTLLTTSPLQDIPFLFEQIHTDALLIDFIVIIFGIVGFLYFFILPGLPFLLISETSIVSFEPKDILLVTIYSGVGNYVVVLIGMIIGIPIIGFVSPLLLLLGSVAMRFVLQDQKKMEDSLASQSSIKRDRISYIAIMGIIVIVFSLIMRYILFNSNIVEFSDVLDYHSQIESIASNDFLLNAGFASRAPLYAMYGYLFTFFTPTILASLKVVSFMYSLLLFAPAYSIVKSLSKNRDSPFIKFAFPVLFAIYPWTMMMASVALQDILLTFYVMSFVALMLMQGQKESLAASVAAGLAFLCRYSAGVLGPLGFVFLLFRNRKEGLRNSIVFLVIWAGIAGSWILRNLVVAGVPLSTTDEGLFSISFLIPGLVNVMSELGLDRHAMNSVVLWIPIILTALYYLQTSSGREKIKEYLKVEYLFIYLVLLGQVGTVVLFFSQQYRFMLSIIWFIPIIWILLMDSFDVPGKKLLTGGWIIFSIMHSLNITRNYWVFYLGRAPSTTGPYEVIPSIFPTLTNLGVFLIGLGTIIAIFVLLNSAMMKNRKKEVFQVVE